MEGESEGTGLKGSSLPAMASTGVSFRYLFPTQPWS